MILEEVYKPIENQLLLVENKLKSTLNSYPCNDSVNEILNYFLKIRGKRLRPALTLLSAGLINDRLKKYKNDRLIHLSVALEFIHSTSLIHDDIIDDDYLRRGQTTLNSAYGRKIAVLTGDALYARAFSILSAELPKEFGQSIIKMTEGMCGAEIEQAKNSNITKDSYLAIIRGKTAELMSICCRLGSLLAGATSKEAENLTAYGLNLGIAYQIADDILDDDIDSSLGIGLKDAESYAANAIKALNMFVDSSYKRSLIQFVGFILNYAQSNIKKFEGVREA